MAARDNFTEAEWREVLRAPMLASFAVTAADPGGLWSTIKEAGAAGGALRDARGERSLVGEVVAAYETSDGRRTAREGVMALAKDRSPAESTDAAVDALARIAEIVDANAPDEAPDFKAWIREVAVKVAEAGTEGGFLGFGGEKVSDAEHKVLADIEAALDTDDTPLDGGPVPV